MFEDPIHDIGKPLKFFPAWAVLRFDHKIQAPKVKEALSTQDSSGWNFHGHEDKPLPITAEKCRLFFYRPTTADKQNRRICGLLNAHKVDTYPGLMRFSLISLGQSKDFKRSINERRLWQSIMIFFIASSKALLLSCCPAVFRAYAVISLEAVSEKVRHAQHRRVFSLYLKPFLLLISRKLVSLKTTVACRYSSYHKRPTGTIERGLRFPNMISFYSKIN